MLNGLKQLQNILIVGGKSEIALQTARNIPLAPNGKTLLLGRNMEEEMITLEGPRVKELNYDISNSNQRTDVIRELFDQNDIDLVILAVGCLGLNPIDSSLKIDQEVLDVNFSHSAEVLGYITHRLKVQGHGKILVISSVASLRPRKSNYVYGAAKAGIDFFARGLQLDLAESGVQICIARPGFVHSNMTKGLNPAPFAISSAKAGKICAQGLLRGKKVFYVPGILRYVMLIVRLLPNKILNKLN